MKKSNAEIEELFAKKVSGGLTEEDTKYWNEYLASGMEPEAELLELVELWDSFELKQVDVPPPPWKRQVKQRFVNWRGAFRYVAVLIVFLISGLIWAFLDFNKVNEIGETLFAKNDEITFQIEDRGAVREEALSDLVTVEGFDYDGAKNLVTVKPSLVQEKTIIVNVPRGRRIKVKLPDGSIASINSESELQFPDRFTRGVREVKLMFGEAFFEVQKSSAPFIVRLQGMNVRVLGTEFNVSNYHGEDKAITLVEGEIALYDSDERDSEHLTKGMQAFFSKDRPGTMLIRNVDASRYSCWKDGVFRFENNSFEEMELRMERWFGVEITNNNDAFASRRFTGDFDKEDDIQYVMSVLTDRLALEYTVEDDAVIIK